MVPLVNEGTKTGGRDSSYEVTKNPSEISLDYYLDDGNDKRLMERLYKRVVTKKGWME